MKDLPYEIIGARFGLACPHEAVADGPQALRAAGLIEAIRQLGIEVEDGGDVFAPQKLCQPSHPRLRNFEETVSFGNDLSARVLSSWENGKRPVVLGGDHSISMATVGATSEYVRTQHGGDAQIGLLWVDAHADLNTADTSPSGNIHGLP
ncbi:MAG: arginase family protein, partial [Bdellovibrionales bacterium]|nr:arginase family protein [Bdellovibrionales bacterium]